MSFFPVNKSSFPKDKSRKVKKKYNNNCSDKYFHPKIANKIVSLVYIFPLLLQIFTNFFYSHLQPPAKSLYTQKTILFF